MSVSGWFLLCCVLSFAPCMKLVTGMVLAIGNWLLATFAALAFICYWQFALLLLRRFFLCGSEKMCIFAR